MKKTIIFLATAAIAALASVSCNKELSSTAESVGPKVRITIGAKPEAAREAGDDTRTYISEETPGSYVSKWSNSGEQLGLIFGELNEGLTPATLTADPSTGDDPIFTGEVNLEDGTYDIFLFYPRSSFEKTYKPSGDNPGTVGLNLKAVQNPELGTFDPSCDIMGWATDDAEVSQGSLVLENITLMRPMAILRVNLNAPANGKATEDEVGCVTGFKMEVPDTEGDKVVLTGRAAISSMGEITNWNIKNNYVEAVIDADESITIGEDSGFQSIYLIVNATTIPEGRPINFSVETEGYNGVNKITRTVTAPAGGMTLEAGKVNTIDLTIRDKDFPSEIIVEDYNGEWLMTGVKNEATYAVITYELSGKKNNFKATSALTFSADGSTISSEADLLESKMTFTEITEGEFEGMYTIQDANDWYLYAAASSNNYLKATESLPTDDSAKNYYWTVTKEGEAYSIVATKSSNRNVMQFNPNGSNDAIVSCYSSASDDRQNVVLYPWSMVSGASTDPVITFDGAEPIDGSNSLMVTKTVSASATSVEFNFTKNKYVTELPTVRKYSFSGAWFVQDGGWEVTDGKVTFTLEPNTTEYSRDNQFIVLAPCFTDDARMYLLIKQEAYTGPQVMTVKSLNDQIREDNKTAVGDALEYTGTIENVVVTGVKGDYAFAEDATGGILLFKVSGLAAGVKASGETTIKAYMYNKMPEAVSLSTSGLTLGVASNIPCAEYTSIADLTDSWNDKMSMRSVLKGMTVTAAFSNYNATVSDAAGNTLTVRDYAKSGLSLTVGDVVSITGYPAQYNSTKQFAVLDAADIVPFTDPDTPSLSVSPESLSWGASETDAKTVTVTLNENASGYTVSPETDASWNISDNGQGTISVSPKAANASTTADKTLSLVISHKDDANVSKTVHCTQAKDAAITIADILAGGANTYTGTTDHLLVYSVKGANVILGDNSGKILYYKSNHGLSEGDVITITNPAAKDYNGILEIYDGTVVTKSTGSTVDHGTPVNLNDATAASSTYSTFSATGYHSAVFISMTGTQSGRDITGSNPNTTLYLNVADATHDGKTVNVTGYVYSWYASKSNYNFQAVSIEEDSSTPTLEVNPAALTWTSDDTSSKTITVTLNADASGMDYSYTSTSGDATAWNIQMGSGAMTVSPKATNTGTSDKVLVLKVTHVASSSVYKEVTLTQKAAGSTGGDVTVWADDFSSCTLSGTAITSLSGSLSDFTGSYSSISTTYPMNGAIRVGKSSSGGNITTPVLSAITGTSANLTITFKGAGWNNQTAKITLSASKGQVTEGQTQITSESTMSGTSPTMTGTSYTFHVTGADSTTSITFTTTRSVGIDDLEIVQTN